MIIYDKERQIILDIPVDDESFRYRAVSESGSVTLYYSMTKFVEIPLYSYIDYGGERYTLWMPQNFTKEGSREYEYTVIFGGWGEFLKLVMYKNITMIPEELKVILWGEPWMHLRMLVDCLNDADPEKGWRVGDCIESVRKTISLNHANCYEALQRFADEYKTEFEFEQKTIHLRKVEKFKDEPLALSYGKGKGFVPGTGRASKGEALIKRLRVQGGNRNIETLKYGSPTLLLPKSQTLEYNGRLYKTNADGTYITRADKESDPFPERSIDLGEIYPSRYGTVTEVITIDAENNLYQFVDNTIPANLNFEDYIIEGETMTVIFQSGALVGREFEVKYHHEKRLFEIVPQEYDTFMMPSESLKPSAGGEGKEADTYGVFNIFLPDVYICDNNTKTGASWDMFREAVRFMYDNEDEQYSFTGKLDSLLFKKNWYEIGGRIAPGGYVLFSDDEYQKEGILIRQTGVKDYINDPHAPEIELSNTPVSSPVSNDLGKIEDNEIVNEGRHREALAFNKLRWRDSVERSKMLEKAIDGFSASINPITVSTMHIRIGDEQLQFRFVDSKTNPREVIPKFVMDNGTKMFSAPAVILQHQTLGIDTLSMSHAANEYKYWDITSFPSIYMGDDPSPFYLYVRCSVGGHPGNFLLSKTPMPMEYERDYYFLVGTLSSEWEGARNFETVYGFVDILPGGITVRLIKSHDGFTYFNLAEGEIGGNIRILSGSGYNNLSDKPDLSKYATTTEFGVLSDRIYANVQQINNLTNEVRTAGWITTADGNKLYASIELEDGSVITSLINQTAYGVLIKGSKIDLTGTVTFSSFDAEMQNKINNKANAADLGTMAFEDAVEAAKLGSTIVVGGYLNTDLIKVRRIDAVTGYISGFEIANNRIGMSTEAGSNTGGGLAIYENFFRVGGNSGYVMFGDDVIPSIYGKAFTATGRIVNNAKNTGDSFGYSTANYGLFINVSGGTTNYGIESDAVLKAPAFINTRLKKITFNGTGYDLDFSQANIFMCYATLEINVIMPTEEQVASMFNVKSLPADFGYTFCIKAQYGTKKFTLKEVYDNNDSLKNYTLGQGDAVIILISKTPSFRYQMISNHF